MNTVIGSTAAVWEAEYSMQDRVPFGSVWSGQPRMPHEYFPAYIIFKG